MKKDKKIEEMKEYFGAKTIEEVAQRMGYSKTTANTWRSRGLSKNAINKFELIKSNDLNNKAKSNDIEVNYYPEINVSAGYGAHNDTAFTPTRVTLSRFLIDTFRITDTAAVDLIHIYGDSMEPQFHNGEIAVVERIPDPSAVKNGDTVIANIAGDIYIKRIEKIPFQHQIILRSNNPAYDDITLDTDQLTQLEIVAIVRGKLKAI